MSDGRSPNNDPSMDDILASIRKIISDDEARSQVGEPPVRRDSAAVPPGSSGAPPEQGKGDDVLLLTDLIEEPAAPESQPTSIPLPRIDPVSAPAMSQQDNDSSEPLIGSTVAGATTSAFERLNQAVQDSVPPPRASEAGPSVGHGGKTIEDMVKEMLRPMLKEWLDRNLPPIVERYVEREIVRLTRR
jgi:cell pole-organizing protein PopZ